MQIEVCEQADGSAGASEDDGTQKRDGRRLAQGVECVLAQDLAALWPVW